MAIIPFILRVSVVLTSGGTGTFQYPVPQGESLTLKEWVFTSTGAFGVSGLRTSDGRQYTNASPSTPLPSVLLPSGANFNHAIEEFETPFKIDGGQIVSFDFIDTSGAPNTVTALVLCERETI